MHYERASPALWPNDSKHHAYPLKTFPSRLREMCASLLEIEASSRFNLPCQSLSCKAEELWSVQSGTIRSKWEKFEAGIEKVLLSFERDHFVILMIEVRPQY